MATPGGCGSPGRPSCSTSPTPTSSRRRSSGRRSPRPPGRPPPAGPPPCCPSTATPRSGCGGSTPGPPASASSCTSTTRDGPQVCLDAPPDHHDEELRFWAELTGWSRRHQESRELTALLPPAEQPVQVLVQRLDEGEGPTTAHLDLRTSSGAREAEVTRHVALGATVAGPGRGWTVLRDPVGTTCCVTDHEPR
ncbi:hypothetical protein SAMN04489747_2111 [Auraticoccus monumenti]|uniref:Glyoxalase-like domain-containing protein n=1 Tax=Auraticoccus monumenti TaxID=675864 RepID=A0A1G6YWE1_9ACTN|nr:VOC family protein [Auraticoccus monumenti]SDD94383.1 hypothetical protein SAMN04489747_2111 [Auraticoccus monumenti]